MLNMLNRILKRFARETSGSFSIEAALVLPTLIWGGLAMTTYVDGFRQQTMNLRTTYTLADMLSRQGFETVDHDIIDGLGRVHSYLTESGDRTFLRVTVAYWDDVRKCHVLVWSDSTDNGPKPVTADSFGALAGGIPKMANADSAIIVETWMDYVPAFNIGLRPDRFYNRVITSPRFAGQLKHSDLPQTSSDCASSA